MRISYDPTLNVAYIRLRETDERVITRELEENVLMDVTEDGTIIGFELLNATEQFHSLELENRETGVRTNVAWPPVE